MADVVGIGGVNFFTAKEIEWSDIEVKIEGSKPVTLRSISVNANQDLEHLYGQGNRPIGIQAGNQSETGSFAILVGDLNTLNDAAVAAGGVDVRDTELTATIKYKAAGTRGLRMDTIYGLRISGYDKSISQGDKMMVVNLPWLCMGITSEAL